MVQGLLHHCPSELDPDHMMACCDQFANYFADAISQIYSQLHASMNVYSDNVLLASACLIYMDTFQFVALDVDRIIGQVRPITCVFDCCPSWLMGSSKGQWVGG